MKTFISGWYKHHCYMKSALTIAVVLFTHLSLFAQHNKVPETWTKDFQITYTFSGSMDGSRTSLTLTYDSCIYIRNMAMNAPVTTKFLLSESDRSMILKKMTDLKIYKVKSEMSIAAVYDGWSSLLCVGQHCVNGGTAVKMSDEDHQTFALAHSWLETFAAARDKN
jgi:hypothetical protein